jgi:dTDP-4-dehydrorhamnose 3,5-epimerase
LDKLRKLDENVNLVGVRVWEMSTYEDRRGKLFKAYPEQNESDFEFETIEHFFTLSKLNVIRGMHLQGSPHQVSKIISIVSGSAIDFLIDLRVGSSTYRKLQIIKLDHSTPVSIYIPAGVAHGYLALENDTLISYRMDGEFCKNCDTGFNPKVLKEYLPIDYSDSILSDRDDNLVDLAYFKIESKCLTDD